MKFLVALYSCLIFSIYHTLKFEVEANKHNSNDILRDLNIENETLSKAFVLGKFNYKKDSTFVKIDSIYTTKTIYLKKEVARAFIAMSDAAKNDSIELKILSGTRNYYEQKAIWERKWSRYETLDNINKAKKILEYVQNEYAWNEEFRIFENVSIKDLIKNKSGNVGEINSLLYNLLVSQGIEAKPVLLSTRRNGFITQLYPVLSDFNYMIVKAHINGKAYLLDATDDYLYFGQIPFRCLNMYGRLMDFDNGSEWYDINAEGFSIKEYRYELDLNENTALTGSVNYNATGYHALNDRKRYFNNTEAYADAYVNSYESIDFLDFEIIGSEKTSNDFNSKFNIETICETVGNSIYLNPYLFKFFKENPFKLQERSYPIDFGYKDTFTYRIKINVDESYQIKELPESINIGLPNKKGSFTTMANQEGNSIVIYFKLTFKDSIYYPNYYDSLKTILSKVVDAQKNSLIVLEKKQ